MWLGYDEKCGKVVREALALLVVSCLAKEVCYKCPQSVRDKETPGNEQLKGYGSPREVYGLSDESVKGNGSGRSGYKMKFRAREGSSRSGAGCTFPLKSSVTYLTNTISGLASQAPTELTQYLISISRKTANTCTCVSSYDGTVSGLEAIGKFASK